MQPSYHNLNAYLSIVLDQYYCDKHYNTPTISWSDEYMFSRFGEYQYYDNHICISRLLNTSEVSQEAVISVIYHEILHQESIDHTKQFEKKLALFPKYAELQAELNSYFDNIGQLPSLNPQRVVCGDYSKIHFVLLPNQYDEQYLEQFIYYNQSVFVNADNSILPNYDNAFIIWAVQNQTDIFIIGWSDCGKLYAKKQRIAHKKFGGIDLSYQIKTKSEQTHILLPDNFTCVIPNELFPQCFTKNGYCKADDVKDFYVDDVLSYIKSYSSDFYVVGLLDEAINSLSPLTENNADKLIGLSKKANSAFRSLWISNLAVKQNFCYETIYNRADALRYAGVLECAFIDFMKAIEMKPELVEPKIEFIKLCVMLNKIEELCELVKQLGNSGLEKYFKKSELNIICNLMQS